MFTSSSASLNTSIMIFGCISVSDCLANGVIFSSMMMMLRLTFEVESCSSFMCIATSLMAFTPTFGSVMKNTW